MASVGATPSSHEEFARAVDALVDEWRSLALWHLRPDYHPRTDLERLQALESIRKYGDVDAFKRASRLQEWLSRHSNATSAGR